MRLRPQARDVGEATYSPHALPPHPSDIRSRVRRVQVFASRQAMSGLGGLDAGLRAGCYNMLCARRDARAGDDKWAPRCWGADGSWRYDWREWVVVGSAELEPSWAEPGLVSLALPVPIEADHTRAFYMRCTPAGRTPDEVPLVAGMAHGRAADRQDHALVFSLAHNVEAHLLLGEVTSRQLWEGCLAGGVISKSLPAADPRLTHAERALERTLSTLEQLLPIIGNVNRQLVDEWHGRETLLKPSVKLELPPPPAHATTTSSVSHRPAAGVTGLDHLWDAHPAQRTLWRQFLGADAPAARLRAAVRAARSCRLPETASLVLEDAVAQLPPDGALQAALSAVQQALDALKAAGPAASVQSADGALAAVEDQLTLMLLPRARGWLASPEADLFERLQRAEPAPVSLASFSLLRLYGKGACSLIHSSAARCKPPACASCGSIIPNPYPTAHQHA